MSESCFFPQVLGPQVCLVLAAAGIPDGTGQGSPGALHLPPESMSPPALGLPISQCTCCISSLISGCTLPPISLSLLSQRAYALPLAGSPGHFHTKGQPGLASTLPPFPPPSLPRVAMTSYQTKHGFPLFSAAWRGSSWSLPTSWSPLSPLLTLTQMSHPNPGSGLGRFSVPIHLFHHLTQPHDIPCLLDADLSKMCISSQVLSPSSHFPPATR